MYSHAYLVKTTGGEDDGAAAAASEATVSRDALFQCGDVTRAGRLRLGYRWAFGDVALGDVPALARLVQRQQDALPYLCDGNIPSSSAFYKPMTEIAKARDFVLSEITGPAAASMTKLKEKHPWIEDEDQVFFELLGDAASLFPDVMFIASKSYISGMIVTTIYFEGVLYVTLREALGDQPLLDLSFPDLGLHGRGVTLGIYDGTWLKLSMWEVQKGQVQNVHEIPDGNTDTAKEIQPATNNDLSSDSYCQSYCILKSDNDSDIKDVMFRFGRCVAKLTRTKKSNSCTDEQCSRAGTSSSRAPAGSTPVRWP